MYLTEILASAENLSVFEKIAQISWGGVFTWKDLFEFVGAVSVVVGLVWGLIKWIKNNFYKISAPYKAYKEDIDAVLGEETRKRSEKYYIPTRGQDVDPCNEEEIRENNGKYNTEEMIPFLCKKAFSKDSFGKHYIILADSGMGKTTFLVNLYRYYVLKKRFWLRDRKSMRYIPLSSENCMKQIQEIENQGKTILLLDALDESKAAMTDCDAFMGEILKQTESFYKIVITCRTHFFSDAKNEPENTGLIRAGTGDKNAKFTKKYITPFSDKEVKMYLRKRFKVRFDMRRKAQEIIKKVPSIMARPLILNWIDCLIESDKKLEHTFEIYKTIIDRWVQREPEVYTKGKLLRLSRSITEWMMNHATTVIPASVVEEMACNQGIDLLPIVAKSRSLLNRNSGGEYKFAHRSFLEYFLSECVFDTGLLPVNEKYLHSMSGFRCFLSERFLELFNYPWGTADIRKQWRQAILQNKKSTWFYSMLSYRKSQTTNNRRLKMRLFQLPVEIKPNGITLLSVDKEKPILQCNYVEFVLMYGKNDEKYCYIRKLATEKNIPFDAIGNFFSDMCFDSTVQDERYMYLPWDNTDIMDVIIDTEVIESKPSYRFVID